jgi:hypothetical protein
MRTAKSLMLFSLSAFLLAASWSLLVGRPGAVAPARAQTADRFVGLATYGGSSIALTESGGVWRFDRDARDLSAAKYLGQLGGDKGD